MTFFLLLIIVVYSIVYELACYYGNIIVYLTVDDWLFFRVEIYYIYPNFPNFFFVGGIHVRSELVLARVAHYPYEKSHDSKHSLL